MYSTAFSHLLRENNYKLPQRILAVVHHKKTETSFVRLEGGPPS